MGNAESCTNRLNSRNLSTVCLTHNEDEPIKVFIRKKRGKKRY